MAEFSWCVGAREVLVRSVAGVTHILLVCVFAPNLASVALPWYRYDNLLLRYLHPVRRLGYALALGVTAGFVTVVLGAHFGNAE